MQKRTDNFFQKKPFERLFRFCILNCKTATTHDKTKYRLLKKSMAFLQAAAEQHCTMFSEQALDAMIHAGRVTAQPKDLWVARIITNKDKGLNLRR